MASLVKLYELGSNVDGVGSEYWCDAATKRINLLKEMEEQFATEFFALAKIKLAQASSTLTIALVITGVTLVMSICSVGISC